MYSWFFRHGSILRREQNSRADSLLFASQNNGSDSTPMAHRARQASRRISSELAGLSNQQNGGIQKRKVTDTLQPQNTCIANESSGNLNQHSTRLPSSRNYQKLIGESFSPSIYPFHIVADHFLGYLVISLKIFVGGGMQPCKIQSSLARETLHSIPGNAVNNFKEVSEPTGYTDMSMCEITNQPNTFISPSNSSSSTFEIQQVDGADNISSVVSMLKGTIERKKLTNYHTARDAIEENMLSYYGNQEVFCNSGMSQHPGNHISENQGTHQDASVVQARDTGILQTVQGSLDVVLESESSVAAPIISIGFDTCDGLSNASQALNVYDGSRNQVG
ncbi:hypothetical protein K7X08_020871 [Anisodus acutangulus]|uniref:Uncharacterized protein n=1 Tax=Anisodus acutangulus TaxID=402998 RepID=A0A9Q1MXJ0_9SOLA|nr:hypothetical protein K7X08_020871 [Anisodus acutangulus]